MSIQAKEGILLDQDGNTILNPGEAAGSARSSHRAGQGRPGWEEFVRTARSRTTTRAAQVKGWGIIPLTLFIAVLIPIILLLFVTGVALFILIRTFITPLLSLFGLTGPRGPRAQSGGFFVRRV